MNFSIYNADRATHLRIVVTALVAGIAIVAFASSAQIRSDHWLANDQGKVLKVTASGELRSIPLTKIALR